LLVIIQARTSSRRFKNKILYSFYGKKLIQHVFEKIRKCRKVEIIVSTSTNKEDDKLVKFLIDKKIKYFRGSLNNVAKRLYDTAISEKKGFFLRISGDSPFIDFRLINKSINIFKKNKRFDLITNIFPRTFPSGQSVEIIKTSALGKNLKFFSRLDKEHVTRYFYRNSPKFKIKNFANKKKTSIKKLSIDTLDELKKILKTFTKKKFLNYSYLNEQN
jgi:spore coat polysaccharide biosynthesis protein SpsF (cytidylyltransferase family)